MNLLKGRLQKYRCRKAFMIPSSLLVVLCLLYLRVQGVERDVNTAALAKTIQYFYDNVQLKTNKGTDAQYTIAITVPPAHCTQEGSDIQTVFSKQDAQHVKDKLNKGEKCLFSEDGKCTPSGNVIATRPDPKTKEHSEHILLYPKGSSPMDKLLANADKDSCVVFFSYNSPCVKTCIKGNDNILDGLSNWINKRKEGMNALVFQEIWQKDSKKGVPLEEEFLKIDAAAPLYRCKRTNNVMECRKCVENNNVDPFCLPEKNRK